MLGKLERFPTTLLFGNVSKRTIDPYYDQSFYACSPAGIVQGMARITGLQASLVGCTFCLITFVSEII